MNKPLIFVGTALSVIGLIAVAPAQAGTLTFDFEVDASSEVTFSSRLGGIDLGGVTVPDSLQVTAESVTGNFTVLDDPAQFTDGSLDIDYDFINDALISSTYGAMLESLLGDYGLTSSQAVQLVDDLFNVNQFAGSGVLTSKDSTLVGNPSPFDISYNSSTKTVTIAGYDTEVAESCLSTTCLIDGNLSFDVNLVLSEFIDVTNALLDNSSISLSPEASDAIASLQQLAFFAQRFRPTLPLGTVAIDNVSAIIDLDSSDPVGSELGVEITGGLVTATATTGTQEEEILSESLSSSWVSVNTSVGVTNLAAATTQTVVAEPDIVTSTDVSGGSLTINPTGPITLVNTPVNSNNVQDVPEPSILLGLLGTAALIKRGRKKTIAQ